MRVGSGLPGGGCAVVASPLMGVLAVVVVLSGWEVCAGESAGADMLKKKRRRTRTEGKGGVRCAANQHGGMGVLLLEVGVCQAAE